MSKQIALTFLLILAIKLTFTLLVLLPTVIRAEEPLISMSNTTFHWRSQIKTLKFSLQFRASFLILHAGKLPNPFPMKNVTPLSPVCLPTFPMVEMRPICLKPVPFANLALQSTTLCFWVYREPEVLVVQCPMSSIKVTTLLLLSEDVVDFISLSAC